MLLQGALSTDNTVPEYLQRDFLAECIAQVPDAAVRNMMLTLRENATPAAANRPPP
jgi:hypothetical protein